MGKLIAYTDGASKGNPGPGGAGTIVIYPDGSTASMSVFEEDTTNNRMEITAIINIFKFVDNSIDEIIIYTDSEYCANSITTWIFGWIRNDWNTTSGPVKNKDLWEKWADLSNNFNGRIQVNWVKGHSVNALNNEADALANYAIDLNTKIRKELKK